MVKVSKFFSLSKEAQLYILSSILAVFAARIFGTIIQPYLGIQLKFTIFQISLIYLILTLLEGILTLSLGILADFLNSYDLLILSLTAISIGILFLILSNTFLVILIAITLIYIGFNVRSPLMRVIIGKRLSKSELGMYFTIVPFTSIAAPLISAYIAQENYKVDFILTFIIIIILILIILRVRAIISDTQTNNMERVNVKSYIKLVKEDKYAIILPSLIAIVRFIFGTSFLYIPLYFTEIIKGSLLELGIMFSTETIAISLASFPSKFLSDSLGNVNTLAMTRILAGITYSLLYFVRSPVLFIIINFIGTLFIAMDNVPEVSLISKMKTANLSMSLIDSVSTLLSISSPIIALYIWVNISPEATFLPSLLVIIPSVMMFKYKVD
ncbi:MFS transporter [Saccharolobus shibatae]|uniref:MFS transporter n=1 Tax=Saccharolobus shibatae TaxID=2286 RepID=A0A8F5GWM3_9CREN|nr:MFS transporter [Saccharolobus shibatae]QXJ32323.1 hypothetical protein J5U21_01974 [Saccharolobus shibatae]QXJ35378.1 hypothetical protein J5U22_01925 [Saccharolobus shibatae]